MDFGTRRLLRHRTIYRSLYLPFGIARLWSNVEEVSFEYVEGPDEVIIRPVHSKAGARAQTQATEQAKIDATNHLPSTHFGI